MGLVCLVVCFEAVESCCLDCLLGSNLLTPLSPLPSHEQNQPTTLDYNHNQPKPT